jgi:hypothetical protein
LKTANADEDNMTEEVRQEIRKRVYADIERERHYQIERWGHEFDKKNTRNDWVVYCIHYLTRASTIVAAEDEFMQNMVKVATLAVAAIENSRVNDGTAPRHYDE